jgi:acetyl esterase/lipase
MWAEGVIPQSEHSAFDRLMVNVSWYLEDVSNTDPLAYPGSSDAVLAKFPPTLFLSGTRAFEMSPAIIGHARLLKLGVDSSLYIVEGGGHGGAVPEGTPEAWDTKVYIAHWFDQHLAR